MLQHIDRYGVEAVMGRAYLGAGEIRRFTMAENIVAWYRDRQRSDNWVTWSKSNPEAAELLTMAVRIRDGISSDS